MVGECSYRQNRELFGCVKGMRRVLFGNSYKSIVGKGLCVGFGDVSPESAIGPEAIAVCGSFAGFEFSANGVHIGFDGRVAWRFDDEEHLREVGELN